MTSIKRRMAKGATWMLSLKFAVRSLGLISTIILARLLMPSDFGLIALATAMIAVVKLFGAFNFEVALIQNQEATGNHCDTTWTLNLMLAAVTALVLVLLATPMANFFDEPRLAIVIYFLAVGVAISGLDNVGVVDFRKNLEFDREFRLLLSQKIVSFAVVVPLAFILRNYWALVAGILAGRIAGMVASYIMHPYRPRIALSAWRELVDFSKWLLLDNALYILRHRSADFIIGKTAGATHLGIFTLSYEISNLAATELAAPIDRAVLPGYSQMSTDNGALRNGYFSVIGLIVLIGVPIAVGIAATAKLLVPVVLGPKWMGTIEVIEVLAIAGMIAILASSIGPLCIALGKPRYLIPISGIYVITLLPLLLILTPRFHSLGAAWAYLGAAAVSVPAQVFIALRLIRAKAKRFFDVVSRPLSGAAVMYVVVRFAENELQSSLGLIDQAIQLATVAGIGFVTYVSIVLGLWYVAKRPEGAETVLVERVVNLLRGISENKQRRQ